MNLKNILDVLSDLTMCRSNLCLLAMRLSHFTYTLFSIKFRKESMNTKKMGVFVILAVGMITAITATTLSFAVPVMAEGDHHDEDGKKCKNNDDNNCNDEHKTQKIYAKNECEVENYNKDHSKNNDNINELTCITDAQNLNDVFQGLLLEEPLQGEQAQ